MQSPMVTDRKLVGSDTSGFNDGSWHRQSAIAKTDLRESLQFKMQGDFRSSGV
jgi:hypothetical protein